MDDGATHAGVEESPRLRPSSGQVHTPWIRENRCSVTRSFHVTARRCVAAVDDVLAVAKAVAAVAIAAAVVALVVVADVHVWAAIAAPAAAAGTAAVVLYSLCVMPPIMRTPSAAMFTSNAVPRHRFFLFGI